MDLPPFDRVRAAGLFKESASNPLSSYDIASKAHRRWDLRQHFEAGLPVCVAFERARSELSTEKSTVDQSPNYFVRAAINFALAGETAVAAPMLNEATRFDWRGLGLENDSHMTEWAFVQLLLIALRNSKHEFSDIFERGVRCRELGWEFPKIHPQQEALLRASMELALRPIVQRLVELVANRRPISREARALLRSAEEFLALAQK